MYRGISMLEVKKLSVLKDDEKVVTNIIAEGIQQAQTFVIGNDLTRCFEREMSCAKFESNVFHFIPNEPVKIKDVKNTRRILIDVFDDFFDVIYIKRDVLAYKKQMLIRRLRVERNSTSSTELRQCLTDLINYIDQEGYAEICDNSHCTNTILIEDVIKNHSLKCPICLQQED